MLWYERHGKDVFRRLGPAPTGVPGARPRVLAARYDVTAIAETAAEREAAIWEELVHARREVGRALYHTLADALPHATPSPRRFRVIAGADPEPVGKPLESARGPRRAKGRRPSHAANATKS